MAATSHVSTVAATPQRRTTVLGRILGPITSRRTWSATAFLVASAFAGAFWFATTIALVVFSAATLVIVIGIPLAMAAARTINAGGRSERRRVGRHLGVDIADPGAPTPSGGGVRGVADAARDVDTRRTFFYLVALLPCGVVWASVAVVAWAVPLGLLSTPALVAAGVEPTASSVAGGWEVAVDSMAQAWAIAAVGTALLPLAPRVIRHTADGAARLATSWLTPTH